MPAAPIHNRRRYNTPAPPPLISQLKAMATPVLDRSLYKQAFISHRRPQSCKNTSKPAIFEILAVKDD